MHGRHVQRQRSRWTITGRFQNPQAFARVVNPTYRGLIINSPVEHIANIRRANRRHTNAVWTHEGVIRYSAARLDAHVRRVWQTARLRLMDQAQVIVQFMSGGVLSTRSTRYDNWRVHEVIDAILNASEEDYEGEVLDEGDRMSIVVKFVYAVRDNGGPAEVPLVMAPVAAPPLDIHMHDDDGGIDMGGIGNEHKVDDAVIAGARARAEHAARHIDRIIDARQAADVAARRIDRIIAARQVAAGYNRVHQRQERANTARRAAATINRSLGFGGSPDDAPDDIFGEGFGSYQEALSLTRDDVYKFLKKKKSIIQIKNRADNMCVGRAVAVVMAKGVTNPKKVHVSGELRELWCAWFQDVFRDAGLLVSDDPQKETCFGVTRVTRNGGGAWQTCAARRIHELSGVSTEDAISTEGVAKIAAMFHTHVRIYDVESSLKTVVDTYDMGLDMNQYDDCCISLLKDGPHVHAITSVKGLMDFSYHCNSCDVSYDARDGHRCCTIRCNLCWSSECDSEQAFSGGIDMQWTRCTDCNRSFPTERCYEKHKSSYKRRGRETCTCEERKKCGKYGCKGFNPGMYPGRDWETHHRCGDKLCTNCKKVRSPAGTVGVEPHKCYIMPKKALKAVEKFIFFDLETRQESGTHIITHCVAQVVTEDAPLSTHVFGPTECVQPSTTPQQGEADEQLDKRMGRDPNTQAPAVMHTSTLDKVESELCSWFFTLGAFRGYTAIAHNGCGYDFQFVLRWAVRHSMEVECVIRMGSKIKCMIIAGVRFIDSLSFLTMALSRFPKTFGLKGAMKGYFPHYFNTRDNQSYVGVYPAPEHYGPDGMSAAGRTAFIRWHKERLQTGAVFNLQQEIVDYCKNDVDLLRRGCLHFKHIFQGCTGVDPFSYVTIASACMAVFRGKYLKPNTVAVLSPEVAAFIRRSFCGGRTNVMKAYHKVDKTAGEQIRYADVTSLYPWVNAMCAYPVGHPQFEDFESEPPVQNHTRIKSMFGFVECDVTCPHSLYHPVLPEKKDNKLLFDLLPKRNTVYSTVELSLAIDMGYTVTRIHRAAWWAEDSTDIFKPYVLNFLKVKQEASGWDGKMLDGRQVTTAEDKLAWVNKYAVEEGVRLDIASVKKNPGLRATAKLCLNSLWGKLGQRSNMPQVTFTESDAEVLHLLDTKVVRDMIPIEGTPCMEVVYKESVEEEVECFTVNIAFAAITTAHARVKLYTGGLLPLGKQAIYSDTDSVIYVWRPGQPEIALGDMLGEWTDELDGGGYIEEFVGVGAKMYGYKTSEGKCTVKSKGFRLCARNTDTVLTFENYVRGVLGDEGFNSETFNPRFITRKRGELVNRPLRKRLRTTYDSKGFVVQGDCDGAVVYPFGYK